MKVLKGLISAIIFAIATVPATAEVPFLRTDSIYSINAVKVNDRDITAYDAALCYTSINGDMNIMVVATDASDNNLTLEVPLDAWKETDINGNVGYEAHHNDTQFLVSRLNSDFSILLIRSVNHTISFFYVSKPIDTL